MLRKLRIVLLIFSIFLTYFPPTQVTAATNVNQLSIGSSLTKWILDDPSNTLYSISSTDKKLFFINSSSLTIDKTLTLEGAPTDIIKSDGNLYVAIDSLKQIIVVDITKEVITQTLNTTSDPFQIVKDGDMIYYAENDQWCNIYAYNLKTNLDQKLPIKTLSEPALVINSDNHILYIGESGSTGSHLIYYSTTDNKVIGTSNYKNGYGFPFPSRIILFDGVNVYYAGRDFSPNDPNRFNGNFGNNDKVIYVNNNLVFTRTSIYNKDSHVKLGEYGYDSDLIASSQNSIFIYSQASGQIKKYDSDQINSSNIISLISGIANQPQDTALSKQINDKTSQLQIQSKLTKWVLDEPSQTLYGISNNDKSLLFINLQTLNLEKVFNFPCNPTDIIKDNGKLYVALDDANQIAVVDMASRTKVDTLYTISDPYKIAKDGDTIYYAESNQNVFAYNLQTNLDQKIQKMQFQPSLAINTDNHILYIGESGSDGSHLIYYSTKDNKVIGTSNYANGYWNPSRIILFDDVNVYYAGFAFSLSDPYVINGNYGNSENVICAKNDLVFTSKNFYNSISHVKLGQYGYIADLTELSQNALFIYNQSTGQINKYTVNENQISSSNISSIFSGKVSEDLNITLGTQVDQNTSMLHVQSKLTKWVLDEPSHTLYGISSDGKSLLFINSQTLNLEKVMTFDSPPTDIIKDNGKIYVALDGLNEIVVIDMASRLVLNTLYTMSDPFLLAKDGNMIYYTEKDQWCSIYAYNLQTNLDQKLPITAQYAPALAINSDNHILYIGESYSSGSHLIYYSTTDNKVIGTSNYKNGYGFPYPSRNILFDGINVYYAGFAFSSEDPNKMYNSEILIYAKQNFLFSSTSVYDEGSNTKLGDFKNKVDLIESNSNSLYTYNQAVGYVEKYSNNSGQLSKSNIGSIVSGIPHDIDNDNTKETATPLNFTTANDEFYQYVANGNGKFENEKDVDYFRITLDAPGMIETDISQLKDAGIVIDLFNNKGELLESLVTDRGNQVIPILDQGLPAGTYYIRLSIDNGTVTNAKYQMKVFYLKSNFVEKEANNTLKTANPITIGKEYIGFSDFDTEDYYKIVTKENGKLTVRGSYSPNVTLYYILINTKGEQVDGWKLDPKDTDETKNLFTVGVRAGTYYLVVSQDDDTYSNEYYETQVNFKADPFTELEHNETTGSATTVLLKRTYNGFISWKNDIDTFKVNVPANANVSFSLSQATSTSFKVEVVNNNNRLIKTFNTKTGKSPMISIGNLNLVKGTYFIKVKYLNGKSDEISYKLQLQPKIYWGKVEYKSGIVGKVVAVSTSKVYKLKSGKLIYVKSAPKGSEFAVYGNDKYGYKLGNGYYVKKDKTVKYYTVPSQIKSNYAAVNK
ncbi:YncE family protein [Gottfriedia acidiceleris]|uniref:Uncharacterized protein n=1 Tax=Gottfriedia acidiceleris TaxID=371036 RepID=A0ABY4JT00_9BACI|nr:hypothetical protein [Gottfriedia acidiceleris]UPM56215.1 hypothetical protein MY490_10435 [Gottfriedia acidiceleris]